MPPTVLIVDDNGKNLKLVRVMLRSVACETLAADDGLRALRIAREHPPDLILLDIEMPLMDGIQVLRTLRGEPETSAIPVIALTSSAMKGDRERFLREGFNDYIPKPIEREGFLAIVREALGRLRPREGE